MPLDDRYGNRLSTTSDTARDQYVAGVDHVLEASHGGVEAFQAAIAADPDFALAHVGLARAAMYQGDMAQAKAAMAKAEALKPSVSAREAAHIDAFAALFSGNPVEARARTEAHVLDHPRDAMVAQLCTNVFGLIGFSGIEGREADLLAYTAQLLPHYGEDWWMLSMHALSLCETGHGEAALRMMERSLMLNNGNANASHFKSHAMYEIGQAEAGIAYIADWLIGYDRRGVLHGHLSWHEALWALSLGDQDRMWRVLDDAVVPGASHSLPINVLTDTAALLYRAELAGFEVAPERWQQISDYATKFFPNPGQSFADMHAALAHAMAGRGDALGMYLDAQSGFAADLVRPVAETWSAIAKQDWQTALTALAPVMATHERIGGSRAQRDLLEFTWLNILLKLGLSDEARRSLHTRRAAMANGAPVSGLV